jgi:DNA polymerase-3 subunit epsilon
MDWLRKLFRIGPRESEPEPRQAEAFPPLTPFFAIFLDVETTGFQPYDRVVSFGAFKLDLNEAINGDPDVQPYHLIFDPIKKSHPRAEAVHGYDDWLLRHQDRFADWAAEIHSLIETSDLVVAHNAEFDFGFLNREFQRCGLASPINSGYCTMEAFRERFPGAPASLSAIVRRLELGNQGETHNALKDAWFAMQVYWFLKDSPLFGYRLSDAFDLTPRNFKEPPPRPSGPLPRRNNKLKERETGEAG